MTFARAPFRLPRAAAVAVTVLTFAAAAHVFAGGELPAFPVMTALTAVVTLSAVMLAGRKMTAPMLAAYLGVGQTVLHLAFSALSGPGAPAPTGAHHGGLPGGTGSVAAGSPHDHLSADVSLGMLAMHAAAVLVTALVMARGESALWALAAWLRPLVDTLEPSAIQTCREVPVAAAPALSPRRKALLRPPVRGPPLCASAGTY
ncbi:hypothetical protein [Paenarthrobacter sp. TYUT067]|uniref:hypothetical protein n=1 Tax=unclassified Paenarthrobacter TaxID=2634190 RepID=UPI00202E6050|nr:hypothetical protein [Paenarthrobacter sp. TYUT067]MCM0616590.1 hypothetical protein [Paenarthrobacter sp. TYUT067]